MTWPIKLLILGGTTEASDLARELAGDERFRPVLSLAGRTAAPRLPPVPYRIGGFGGTDGLARWLDEQSMNAIVDATHPFAARISANAVAAARATGLPLMPITRPPWTPTPGDRWLDVADMAAAAAALPPEPKRIWLTIGGNELAAFRSAPHHRYLVRAVDPPPVDALPPFTELVLARGPYALDDERHLMATHAIDILITKNSGGDATAAKLIAAREARLQVVMVRRPDKPAGVTVTTVEAAIAWLASLRL